MSNYIKEISYNGTLYEIKDESARLEIETLKDVINEQYTVTGNCFNPNDVNVERGGYYDTSNTWVASASFSESGYIRIQPSATFYVAREISAGGSMKYPYPFICNFYDSNKQHVIGVQYTADSNLLTAPSNSNIAYIRIPVKNIDTLGTMLIFADAAPDASSLRYIPYSVCENTHWLGKSWYAYGTSLTNVDNEGKYARYVEQFSGMILTNKAISGGGIVNSNANIKDAIMNTTDGKLDADLITLEVGANDITVPLGTIYDTDDTTYCGALNQCIRYLQQNTNAQIVVISSTSSRADNRSPELKFGTDNHTKFDQVKAMEEVCKVNGCYYVPMGESSGLGYYRMKASDLYNVDNIHHTELGGYNLAKFVWERLKTIPCWYSSLPIT